MIKAFAAYDASSSSTECLTTPALPPLSPDNLTSIGADSTSITLQWRDNSTDEQGFKIEYGVAGTSAWATGADMSSHPGTGLVTATKHFLRPSTQYCFRVTAYNQRSGGLSGRYSTPSNVTCPRTAAPDPPAAPSGLTVSGHTQSSLTLTWSDNATDETGYRVDVQQGTSWVGVSNLGADAQSYTEAWLVSGLTRCYRVVAVNAGGETASGTACGTTDAGTPDLIVKNIQEMDYSDPTTIAGLLHAGDPFVMAWDVCNAGAAAAGSNQTELDISDGQSIVSKNIVDVPPLPSGSCWQATTPFGRGLPTNQYDAGAMADSGGAIVESSEANNALRYGFNIL